MASPAIPSHHQISISLGSDIILCKTGHKRPRLWNGEEMKEKFVLFRELNRAIIYNE
jgi:hypothetical protein